MKDKQHDPPPAHIHINLHRRVGRCCLPRTVERVTMKPEELADLIERLRARHNDTWPMQIGHGDLINEDGPTAADALASRPDGWRGADHD